MRHGLTALLGVTLIPFVIFVLGCVPGESSFDDGSAQGRLLDTAGGVSGGSGPHLEQDGLVVVEAEHHTSARDDILGARQWYLQAGAAAGVGPDPDGYHEGASGEAFMEVLPDTRVTHDDPMEPGSFYDDIGGAALSYEIMFESPGTYYVWVRSYSTGTEDNGLHVGVNGEIHDGGRKLQRCGTGDWLWTNAQRDSGGSSCGVRGTVTIGIPSPGLHTITFYHREDGFEFDRFILTTQADDMPAGAGPPESPRQNP